MFEEILEVHKSRKGRRMPVYIMHPYSTFGDLEKNAEIQKEICANYNTKYFLPVSPILNFHGWLSASEEEYLESMSVCFSLLEMCVCVHAWGNWKESTGCIAESNFATLKNKKVFDMMKIPENKKLYRRWSES